MRGQLVGASIEHVIGKCLVLKDESHRIGSALDLLLNELMHTAIRQIICLGRVPVYQQLLELNFVRARRFVLGQRSGREQQGADRQEQKLFHG